MAVQQAFKLWNHKAAAHIKKEKIKYIIDSSLSSLILQKFLKLTCVTNFISIYSAETVKRLNLLRYNAVDIGIQVGKLHQPLQLQITLLCSCRLTY